MTVTIDNHFAFITGQRLAVDTTYGRGGRFFAAESESAHPRGNGRRFSEAAVHRSGEFVQQQPGVLPAQAGVGN
jgi:hypothetical protein